MKLEMVVRKLSLTEKQTFIGPVCLQITKEL